MPALFTSPNSVALPNAASTFRAPSATAASLVTSNSNGVTLAPNSLVSRSASAGLRTLPKTWKPAAVRTFTQPQPMPVEAPVTTTEFLAIACSLRNTGKSSYTSKFPQKSVPPVERVGHEERHGRAILTDVGRELRRTVARHWSRQPPHRAPCRSRRPSVSAPCKARRRTFVPYLSRQLAHRATYHSRRPAVSAPRKARRHTFARRLSKLLPHTLLVLLWAALAIEPEPMPAKPWLQEMLQRYSTRSNAFLPPSAMRTLTVDALAEGVKAERATSRDLRWALPDYGPV